MKKRRNVWQAGFTLRALSMITRMSGLVDILDIYWNAEDQVVIFTVRRKSEKLFQQDSLRGNYVPKATLASSPILIDLVGVDDALQV